MKNTFDPTIFKNKKTIYIKVPGLQGICKIFDWDFDKKKYQPRIIGLKYYAHKKVSGIQRQQCFETFQQAKEWRASPSIWDSQALNPNVLFKSVMVRFFDEKKKQLQITTWETYNSNAQHLKFFEALPMNQITAQAIDEWLKRLKNPDYVGTQHRSRMTYRHELSLLRQILQFYGEYYCDSYALPIKKRHLHDAIIDHEKFKIAKAKNKNKFIPRAEADRWLEAMLDRGLQDSSKMIFGVLALFQLGSGVRIGEACALEWSDIDLEYNRVSISKSVQWSRIKGRQTRISPLTKTGESRIIYVPSQVCNALKKWKELSNSKGSLIFSIDGNEPIPYRSVQMNYNWAFKRLKNGVGLNTHFKAHFCHKLFRNNSQSVGTIKTTWSQKFKANRTLCKDHQHPS